MLKLLQKLDLQDYFNNLNSFFARDKDFRLKGDINIHFKFIKEFEKYELKPLPKVENLDNEIIKLSKNGHLLLEQIYQFVKIVNYFLYLKKIDFKDILLEWIEKINIIDEIIDICNSFDENGELKFAKFEDLYEISLKITKANLEIKDKLKRLLFSKKLQSYLIDTQVHIINGEQTLLLRAGFNHFLKGKVISRSGAGFFYVIPDSLNDIKRRIDEFENIKNGLIYKIEKNFSNILSKHLKFIKFINKEFDKIDNYFSRIYLARTRDFNFILPNNNIKKEQLINFCHPAIKHAKPISIDFTKSVIIFTGVNAGGKTMALKSILSAIFLSKYLLPYKANEKSLIKSYKNVFAILDDPQDIKNDISTFAGRMVEFSKILNSKDSIIGADEIELGTDANEAAALFKAIILELTKKNQKIIITTHHKRLANLLVKYDFVELYAAIYDEKNQKPTYSFLQGTIGKSYAFETAIRYNIPLFLINKAKKYYLDEKENLEQLIEKSSNLEFVYQKKLKELDKKIEDEKRLIDELKDKKISFDKEIEQVKQKLTNQYKKAIDLAKEAVRQKDKKAIHRALNEANKVYNSISKTDKKSEYSFKIGDKVKFNKRLGVIKDIKNDIAVFESDEGFRIKVKLFELTPAIATIKRKSITINISKPSKIDIKCDLHGLRGDEAIEKLDKFISDSLVAGLDEVLVYHGIGTGRLSKIVTQYLKKHKKVKSFNDAPPHMGGFGAKIVTF